MLSSMHVPFYYQCNFCFYLIRVISLHSFFFVRVSEEFLNFRRNVCSSKKNGESFGCFSFFTWITTIFMIICIGRFFIFIFDPLLIFVFERLHRVRIILVPTSLSYVVVGFAASIKFQSGSYLPQESWKIQLSHFKISKNSQHMDDIKLEWHGCHIDQDPFGSK